MIVGFNINSLEADKKQGASQGSLQVNYSPKIDNIEETSVNAFDEKVAKVEFTFKVGYSVGDTEAAFIEMKGNVLWKGNVEEVIESWEENQSLPENVEAPLMNDLYRKCLSQAVGVADTLGLLPPIPTPKVNK